MTHFLAIIWPYLLAALVAAKPVLWYGLGTGLVNLSARKSQIEAWCLQFPKLAAFFKLARAFGFDPWLVRDAAELFVRGKLPRGVRFLVLRSPCDTEPCPPPQGDA